MYITQQQTNNKMPRDKPGIQRNDFLYMDKRDLSSFILHASESAYQTSVRDRLIDRRPDRQQQQSLDVHKS